MNSQYCNVYSTCFSSFRIFSATKEFLKVSATKEFLGDHLSTNYMKQYSIGSNAPIIMIEVGVGEERTWPTSPLSDSHGGATQTI